MVVAAFFNNLGLAIAGVIGGRDPILYHNEVVYQSPGSDVALAGGLIACLVVGAFFLVLIALSSVGLLVGGIGVMAIMMVSVTSRTREIGVRKALGATRRDIMMQFLIEAATLTGIGGVLGVILGLVVGKGAAMLVGGDAETPLPYTIVAVAVSVAIGLTFGLLPARRAARLDPVEALRYE